MYFCVFVMATLIVFRYFVFLVKACALLIAIQFHLYNFIVKATLNVAKETHNFFLKNNHIL